MACPTSAEVRDILATLDTGYRQLCPHLNLRQGTHAISTWLTQPVLAPTHAGRVTMDHLMQLVTMALEWSSAAGETAVRAERLKSAAELLVLRQDTLRILDGDGPDALVEDGDGTTSTRAHGQEPQRDTVQASEPQPTAKTVATVEEQGHTSPSPQGPCAGVVPIALTRLATRGIAVVECPDCSRTRSLSPGKGVLRFPSHERRTMQTPVTSTRWSTSGTAAWAVVGSEGDQRWTCRPPLAHSPQGNSRQRWQHSASHVGTNVSSSGSRRTTSAPAA
jgi:hypothetical protein